MKRIVARALAVTVIATAGVVPSPLAAQDIEATSAITGVPLPPGYWAKKAVDPLAFELPNGLFGTRSALPPVANASLVAQPAARTFEGEARLPVILALFSDSDTPPFTSEDIDRAVFTGPSETGTFTEFYEEISRGRFTVTGDVFPWVRTSLTMSQVVGTNRGLGNDARVGEYLIEAIQLLDPEVDWGLYDNDGPDGVPNSGDDDGIVDVVTLEYLEVAGSCGGPSIWPHRYGISGWTGAAHETDDPSANGGFVKVDGYITQSVADCTGAEIQSAGTISHEYGHALGLPDYYHAVDGIEPENRRWVLGCWALMAAGSWGCGPVSNRELFGPSHMIAHSKFQLGWLEFMQVEPGVRDAVYELGPIRTTGDALEIRLDPQGRESILLEYRTKTGFDHQIPSEGVLAVRRDYDGDLRPMNRGYRYFLSMLEADGDQGLLRTANEGGDRGMPSDAHAAFGTTSRMNVLTTPSTRRAGGAGTTVNIHEIRVDGGRAYVRLTNATEPRVMVPDELPTRQAISPAETRFRITGGVLPYQTFPGEMPAGLTSRIDEDELVLEGGMAGSGDVYFEVVVRDAVGAGGVHRVGVRIDQAFAPSETLLLHPFVGGLGRDLTPLERTALDEGGNGNGRYDVGDLRRWLFRGG